MGANEKRTHGSAWYQKVNREQSLTHENQPSSQLYQQEQQDFSCLYIRRPEKVLIYVTANFRLPAFSTKLSTDLVDESPPNNMHLAFLDLTDDLVEFSCRFTVRSRQARPTNGPVCQLPCSGRAREPGSNFCPPGSLIDDFRSQPCRPCVIW